MQIKNRFQRVVMAAVATVALAAVLLVMIPLIHAGQKGQKEAPQAAAAFVTVDANIAIKDDESVIDARERAMNVVREEAILRAAGELVSPAILLKDKERLLKTFRPQRETLIEEMKILAEEERPDRSFWIRIKAKVNGALLEELLIKNLHNDQVIVVTLENNLKRPLKRHILEHDLIARIKKKGYAIVDYRTIKNKTVNKLVTAIRQGNTEAVRSLGRYYLTDFVVVGFIETKFSEKTQEIYSSHATGQVKIHKIGSRKELGSLTHHDVKGFGSDEEKSGIDAIKKISLMMSEEAIKNLPGRPDRQVKVSLRELDHYAAYEKAKSLLASLRGVQTVKEGVRDFGEEEATLYVRFTGGLDKFLNQIAALKKFVITKVSGSEIWLEARKMN